MKLLNKAIKILLIVVLLMTASIGNMGQVVKAATFPIEKANLYSKGSYGNMLRYNGVEILTTFVVYQKNGVEYPAYCLDANMPGVGEKGSYTASVENLLNDVMLWRVITNGYPYKTPSQLGCNNEREAFTATKQAVYCMIYGREASWYEAIGEQGVRVKNAMAQILSNAKSSTIGKPSGNIEINAIQGEWQMDAIWNHCVSQLFEITTSIPGSTYNVTLEGNYPEETKIVDVNNRIKSNFSVGERFKIVMPLKNLKQAGSFKINITAKLNTKPVFYGKAPNADWQDYALTAASYEDAKGSKTISYFKNDTKLVVKKQEKDSLKPLEGVEFRIVDFNQVPVYTNLMTDKQGRIELNNMLPGEYYLEEVKAKEGYIRYEEQIYLDLSLNQSLTVTVNNTKERKYEYNNNTQDIKVTQSRQETTVKDDQQYITKNKDEEIINEQHNQNYYNTNQNNKQENITYNHVLDNTNVNSSVQQLIHNLLNKNDNYNENIENQTTNIQNENNNVNKNTQNQNTNIQNKNNNLNQNTQNQNTNIQNENNNKNQNTQNQNTNIQDKNSNHNENTQNVNTNIESKNENVNQNTENRITNIQNTNERINQNTQNQTTNIQNKHENVNQNTQNQATNIQNKNENINQNIQNEATNIQNKNENINQNSQSQTTTIQNQNSNINQNTQNQTTNYQNYNTNQNTNISSLNGVVKLPKTGM